MILEMNDIRKSFGGLEVLRGIDISVGKGETVSVIGPSGSGKSTLLRCATFLETADSGEIKYMGNKAAWTDETGKMKYVSPSELKKFKSCFGLVFQQFNLFPHFTVLKNIIDAPVSVQKRSRDEVTEEAMATRKDGACVQGKRVPRQTFRRTAAACCDSPSACDEPGHPVFRRADERT